MGTVMGKLTDRAVRNFAEAGKYGDGDGLWLKVTATRTKSWVFRLSGREMGLGAYPVVSLADAREKAGDARKQMRNGIDPLDARKAASKPAKCITFDDASEKYIVAHENAWEHHKTAKRWRSVPKAYASPVIGSHDVAVYPRRTWCRCLPPFGTAKSKRRSS